MSSRNAKPLPEIFIYKEQVDELVSNFLTNKHPLLSSPISKDESKSAWLSLEQFEQLVKEMYYQNADGVRVYFGAYSETHPTYANQLTIVLVPTYLHPVSGRHTDIIIDNDADFYERLEAEAKNAKHTDRKNLDTFALCPPTCFDQEPLYPL